EPGHGVVPRSRGRGSGARSRASWRSWCRASRPPLGGKLNSVMACRAEGDEVLRVVRAIRSGLGVVDGQALARTAVFASVPIAPLARRLGLLPVGPDRVVRPVVLRVARHAGEPPDGAMAAASPVRRPRPLALAWRVRRSHGEARRVDDVLAEPVE